MTPFLALVIAIFALVMGAIAFAEIWCLLPDTVRRRAHPRAPL